MSTSGERDASQKCFLTLCIAGFLFTTANFLPDAIMPIFAQSLGASGALVGVVVSSFWLIRVFFEIPLGYISDKIGRRTPIVFGLLIATIASILCSFILDSYQLILARAVWGLGACLFYCSGSALVLDIRGRSGSSIGVFAGFATGGALFGTLCGGYLASSFNYWALFLVGGLILIPTFILCFVSKQLRELGSAERLGNQRETTHYSIKFLRNRRLVFVCCTAFLMFFINRGIISTVFPLHAYNYLNMDVSTVGVLVSMASGGRFLAPFIAGFISDRIGRRKFILMVVPFLSVSMYLLSFAGSFEFLLSLMFISGFTHGSMLALGPLLAIEATDFTAEGAAIGTYRTSFGLGNLAGPVVMTIIATSSALPVFSFAALLALVATMFVLLWRR